MLTVQMFTVYDSKAETFINPFFMMSKGEAIRGFTTMLNDKETAYGKYPADFTLFHIGEYEVTTGTLYPFNSKENLGNGLQFVKQEFPIPQILGTDAAVETQMENQ